MLQSFYVRLEHTSGIGQTKRIVGKGKTYAECKRDARRQGLRALEQLRQAFALRKVVRCSKWSETEISTF